MVLCFVDPEGGALQATVVLFPGEKDKNPVFLDVLGPRPPVIGICCHFRSLANFVFLPEGPTLD